MDLCCGVLNGNLIENGSLSINTLQDLLPGHLISHFGDVAWPARSTDLWLFVKLTKNVIY